MKGNIAKMNYIYDIDEESENLNNAAQCQNCTFERVICLQENKCLLLIQEQLKENYYGKKV